MLRYIIVAITTILLFAVIIKVFLYVCKRARKENDVFLKSAVNHLSKPLLFLAVLMALRIAMTLIPQKWDLLRQSLYHSIAVFIIIGVMYSITKLADVLNDTIFARFNIDNPDNLSARKVHTQLKVIKRIVVVSVCFIGFALILMTFDRVRQLGTSLMASAGLIGIVIGVAAQKTLHTFITGIQIAITQPIRIDDVVIVENEWGRIEEITLTYVVVKIWDQRRLIVPITHFIDNPFQNWTRATSDILGTVFLYVDYAAPIEAIREKLKEIAAQAPQWDKRVCVLQVTAATERTLELRALVSAADASSAWELRCYVREKLIEFIKTDYPDALPKFRAEFEKANI